jgi:hypothetical protein
MAGFFKRTAAVLAGIVLGIAIVVGAGPWRERRPKPDATPEAPIQRERAPDTRV